MTREDILRLADKVGMMPFAMAPRYQSQLAKQLGEFAALVAAHEREACAEMVDHILKEGGGTYGKAIRARGEQEEPR